MVQHGKREPPTARQPRVDAAWRRHYLVIIFVIFVLPMKRGASLFAAAAFGLIAASISLSSSAALYKWIDENGRVAYGDTPPAGVKAERLTTMVAPADPNAVRDLATKDAEIRKRQQQSKLV